MCQWKIFVLRYSCRTQNHLRSVDRSPRQDPNCRVARPMVRLGYCKDGRASDTSQRGREPFVPISISWDEALDITAEALVAARDSGGNRAIYGSSYGWASAGRFHHAQSQIHRFLQKFGGYTDSVDTHSFAAAEVLIPHIIGMDAYVGRHAIADHRSDDSAPSDSKFV